jgi:hypothetical protein
MKYSLAFLSLLLSCGSALAYTPEQCSDVEKNAKGVWTIAPDPGLPNVLILGDSISIGYTLQVHDLRGRRLIVQRAVRPRCTDETRHKSASIHI